MEDTLLNIYLNPHCYQQMQDLQFLCYLFFKNYANSTRTSEVLILGPSATLKIKTSRKGKHNKLIQFKSFFLSAVTPNFLICVNIHTYREKNKII